MIIKPPTKKLLEGLEEYFLETGPLHNITFDEFLKIVEQVYNHYMCNTAYELHLAMEIAILHCMDLQSFQM